jgi:hypothetical protein
MTALSIPVEWSVHGRCLGVGSHGAPVVFHSIEVVEITGEGRVLPAKR